LYGASFDAAQHDARLASTSSSSYRSRRKASVDVAPADGSMTYGTNVPRSSSK